LPSLREFCSLLGRTKSSCIVSVALGYCITAHHAVVSARRQHPPCLRTLRWLPPHLRPQALRPPRLVHSVPQQTPTPHLLQTPMVRPLWMLALRLPQASTLLLLPTSAHLLPQTPAPHHPVHPPPKYPPTGQPINDSTQSPTHISPARLLLRPPPCPTSPPPPRASPTPR
jgi:hypothetical protein